MIEPSINFTPGPAQLYFTVPDHVRTAFREGIPSLSHRSKKFESIYRDTVDGMRALLGLPESYQLFFTGSATEIWERSIQNLVAVNSLHIVNGAFSKRYFEIAQQLQKQPVKIEFGAGQPFPGNIYAPPDTSVELIAVTHNETSTGVSMPLDIIYKLRSDNPQALMIVDAVSSLPFPDFDYSKIDSAFFSVQKGFGLPAGLGVWMVNDRCMTKADQLLSRGICIGSYHTIPSLKTHALRFQTPETPNVLGIYLLSKVVADMLRHGIKRIRNETEYKANILYQALEMHPYLKPYVTDKACQSKTVIVAETSEHTEKITSLLLEKGLQPGDGYGAAKKHQLRFANFPTHAKEHFELLVDTLALN